MRAVQTAVRRMSLRCVFTRSLESESSTHLDAHTKTHQRDYMGTASQGLC